MTRQPRGKDSAASYIAIGSGHGIVKRITLNEVMHSLPIEERDVVDGVRYHLIVNSVGLNPPRTGAGRGWGGAKQGCQCDSPCGAP